MPAMAIVSSGTEIGAGEALVGQPCTVGAAPDRENQGVIPVCSMAVTAFWISAGCSLTFSYIFR